MGYVVLIMSLLASFANTYESSIKFVEDASRFLAKVLIPQPLSPQVLSKYVRKAFRSGAWRVLSPEEKALLIFLSKYWRKEVRSETLTEVLRKVLMKIELTTLKGKAILYGLVEYVRMGFGSLTDAIKNITKLLCLGISYLNNPPMYRVYG